MRRPLRKRVPALPPLAAALRCRLAFCDPGTRRCLSALPHVYTPRRSALMSARTALRTAPVRPALRGRCQLQTPPRAPLPASSAPPTLCAWSELAPLAGQSLCTWVPGWCCWGLWACRGAIHVGGWPKRGSPALQAHAHPTRGILCHCCRCGPTPDKCAYCAPYWPWDDLVPVFPVYLNSAKQCRKVRAATRRASQGAMLGRWVACQTY